MRQCETTGLRPSEVSRPGGRTHDGAPFVELERQGKVVSLESYTQAASSVIELKRALDAGARHLANICEFARHCQAPPKR